MPTGDLLVRHERLNHAESTGQQDQANEFWQQPSIQGSVSNPPVQEEEETAVDKSIHEPPMIPMEDLAHQYPVQAYEAPLEANTINLDHMSGLPRPPSTENNREQQIQTLNGFSPYLPAQIPMFPHPGFLSDSFQDLAAFMDNHTPFTDDFASFVSSANGITFTSPDRYPNSGGFPLHLGAELATTDPAQQADEVESFSQLGSRLPSLQPEERAPISGAPPQVARPSNLFENISSHMRDVLLSKVHEFATVVPEEFQMPTRLALYRYMTAYVKGFHEHMPFLHIPTLSAEGCSIELVLAIASIGAQYCFEPDKTVQLFQTSHAIARERVRRRDASSVSQARSDREHTPMMHSYSSRGNLPQCEETIQTAQALLLLMAEATWSNHRTILREALAIQSILATLVRDHGLKTPPLPEDVPWEGWAIYESTKRTKWIVFCFFDLHTIVYNIPSPILSSDVDGMLLPCQTATFRATSHAKWLKARENETNITFKDAFSNLFQEDFSTVGTAPNSTLGNYILVHALIQHIYLVREVFRHRRKDIPEDDIASTEIALRNWKAMWKHTPDSSIDPSNPMGPVSFNSTALLRLAYIRLNADIGPGRALHTRDPTQIANAFLKSQLISRTPRLLRPVLHAAHALSIPIRIGVHLVAQTQTFRWSIQHSLATLECAFLLSKWLEALSSPAAIETITPGEYKMVMLVKTMLDETDFAVPSHFNVGSPSSMKLLAANVLRVWAKAFYGPAQVWAIVDVVRASLELCADLVENNVT
ncbi:hypothetical protein N7474_011130 [Penicillium riverlandense]|uniref:uncharacterized protein n=1 Tax=Penicillium riverlandense TaxID=1903569 RepID=UPI002549BEAE|nr:uncharacterized protein N7474_011130 [Penicillium riverlandense]KAJ5805243.1 hypothetical protein N7474_011130 [Penicillium riverlandense]